MTLGQLTPSQITDIGVNVIRNVLRIINSFVEDHPELAFQPITLPKTGKKILTIDYHTELACVDYLSRLARKFHDRIEVFGEERLSGENPDLSKQQGLTAIIDMVDGTDLLRRGLYNWCSALIFFNPSRKKILGAFVGIPAEGIYYATEAPGAYKRLLGSNNQLLKRLPIKLKGVSQITSLKKASICFYGQKINRLLSIAKKVEFLCRLEKLGENPETRIYNFAGNPMMVKLADGCVDAVFDLGGQYPHDVAPGAFIAMKAGAVFGGLNNQEFDIEKSLLKPAQRGPGYILASTPKLFEEIQAAVS